MNSELPFYMQIVGLAENNEVTVAQDSINTIDS